MKSLSICFVIEKLNNLCFVALACPRLTAPENGQLMPHQCATGKTFAGQHCTARCRTGFRLVGGSTYHCLANQQWRGPNENPRCERIGTVNNTTNSLSTETKRDLGLDDVH